ncbi:MAG: transposase [Anaerolineae bacterium]|jgi:transposase
MSMQTSFATEIPEKTRRLVEPLLPADSVYRLVGNEIEQIVSDKDFADMYADDGRPAVNPVVLALVSVFQYCEKLPDRAAADAAVMRLDWKYALRQELTWTGFHFSDLCNFRKRLLEHEREWVVFEGVVSYLQERGYIKKRGKQRTDSTKIIGLVARLSRLELVWETIRVALGSLIEADASWVKKHLPISFVDTYGHRRWDFRLSKTEIRQWMEEAGQEGYWFLDQVEAHGNDGLRTFAEVEQLRRVLDEQFTRGEDGETAPRPPGQAKGDVITTPHDPEARYGKKGGQGWVGYKLQVTETADEESRFITDIEVVPAMRQDNQCLKDIQERLVEREIAPGKQYVDQAYMSGRHIAESLDQGIDLRGYVREGNTSKPEGFRLRDFQIDIEQRQAICPVGKKQVKWARAKPGVKNLIAYHVGFGRQCQSCPHYGPDLCTDRPSGRHLGVNAYHDLIQARRQEASTEAFKEEMNIRAGVEGTVSELVRSHGARRSRFRGRKKNRLQALFVASAANLKRLACCSFLSLAPKSAMAF